MDISQLVAELHFIKQEITILAKPPQGCQADSKEKNTQGKQINDELALHIESLKSDNAKLRAQVAAIDVDAGSKKDHLQKKNSDLTCELQTVKEQLTKLKRRISACCDVMESESKRARELARSMPSPL